MPSTRTARRPRRAGHATADSPQCSSAQVLFSILASSSRLSPIGSSSSAWKERARPGRHGPSSGLRPIFPERRMRLTLCAGEVDRKGLSTATPTTAITPHHLIDNGPREVSFSCTDEDDEDMTRWRRRRGTRRCSAARRESAGAPMQSTCRASTSTLAQPRRRGAPTKRRPRRLLGAGARRRRRHRRAAGPPRGAPRVAFLIVEVGHEYFHHDRTFTRRL